MPNRIPLQVHLLAIPERISTFSAPRTRRMEVVVATCLQHFSAYEAIAVGTFDTVRLLVALLAERHAVLAHVLTVQNGRAIFTPATRGNRIESL